MLGGVAEKGQREYSTSSVVSPRRAHQRTAQSSFDAVAATGAWSRRAARLQRDVSALRDEHGGSLQQRAAAAAAAGRHAIWLQRVSRCMRR